jgi:hypothetical protein
MTVDEAPRDKTDLLRRQREARARWEGLLVYEYAFNARGFREWRARTWNEVRAEASDAYAAFLSAAEAAPEEILFTPERPAWQIIAFNGYLHYEDFAPSLRVWPEFSPWRMR